MRLLPAVAAALALAAPSATAQTLQVVINEVNFTKSAQWIELYNPTASNVKLGGWSIYHATTTANRFGDYWWGFPANSEIKAGDYVRIHWGALIQTPTDKRNIYTGHTNWHFLFGHGFEAFDMTQGAIAICTTQDNQQVNAANVFSDWWQWGTTGFKRESVATGNKPVSLWSPNIFAPKVPAGASLMRLAFLDKFPHPLSALRQDFSPTPLADNTEGVKAESIGSPCGRKTVGCLLVANDLSYHGNADFSVTVKNTAGIFENMLYIANLGKMTTYGGAPLICDILDPAAPGFTTPFFTTTPNSTMTKIPLTVSGTNGAKIYIQAVVFGSIPSGYESFTNRLAITVSK